MQDRGRHFYASVLLDVGENIKALSTYLGHTDPGFTLRVYTHLLPSSEGRSRKVVDSVVQHGGSAPDGPAVAGRLRGPTVGDRGPSRRRLRKQL